MSKKAADIATELRRAVLNMVRADRIIHEAVTDEERVEGYREYDHADNEMLRVVERLLGEQA